MTITLSIGGYPICGAVGEGAEIIISAQEAWGRYCRWVESIAEGRSVSPLKAEWSVNGCPIEEPSAWFIGLRVS